MRNCAPGVAVTFMMLGLAGCPGGQGGGEPAGVEEPGDTPTLDALTVSGGDDQTLFTGNTGTATAVVTGATGAVSFQWAISAPGAIVEGATAETVTFTAATAGTATLTVTATDSDTGAVATDEVGIIFQTPPLTVAAGADQSVISGDSVQLTATPAGGVPPYGFQWLRLSGPEQPVSPTDGRAASITVAGSVPGDVTFQVSVTDAAGATATDDLLVTVISSPANLTFTLNLDNLTGTEGDDVFRAPVLDPASSGSFLPTFQSDDRANGLGGADALNATLIGPAGPVIVPAAINGIEIINLTDLTTAGPQQISAANFSGAVTINSVNSTGPLAVLNIPNLVSLGLINARAGMNAQFQAGAVAGTTDETTLTLSSASADAFQFNGVEILNLVSAGAPNTLGTLSGSGTLTTVNASGDQPLTITQVLPDQVTTFNAAATTGGVSVNFGQPDAKFFGGSGDDSVSFLQFGFGDSADGGAGHDVLRIPAADALAFPSPLTNLAGFEELALTTSLPSDLNALNFGSIDTLRLQAGVSADPPRVVIVGPGTNVILQGDIAGALPRMIVLGSQNVTFTVDTSVRLAGAVNAGDLLDSLTFAGITSAHLIAMEEFGESRIIKTIALPSTGETETLTLSGNARLISFSITADIIDASALTGGLQIALSTSAGVIIGTPGNDDIRASAGENTINAGAGDDLVNGFGGVDTITLGPGKDYLVIDTSSSANRKIITDFDDDPVTGDSLSISTPNSTLSGTDNFQSPASIRDHSSGTVFLGPETELLRINDVTLSGLTSANSLNGTNLLAALRGGIVVNAPGNANLIAIRSVESPVIGMRLASLIIPPILRRTEVAIYYGHDVSENALLEADEIALVAVLQGPNVRLADLVSQNFGN